MKQIVEATTGEKELPKKKVHPVDDELEELLQRARARIIVVGVGGAGCNTITRIMEVGIKGAETVAINTDAQDLLYTVSDKKILAGRELTRGLGAGNDPKLGEEAARESETEIKEALQGADMVFITAGLGGGTGTGGAPVVAQIAKRLGALTVAVVTLPFTVEGLVRQNNAEIGLEKLRNSADTVIVIPNDKLLEVAPNLPIGAAFRVADEILTRAVKGITELITKPGLVNLDFADVRRIMSKGGVAMIGIGESDTENRAEEAVKDALSSPLLDVDISGAKAALINVTGGQGITLSEAEKVVEIVSGQMDPEAEIIYGVQIDDELENTLRVLVIASGVSSPYILGPETEIEVEEEGVKKKIDLGIRYLD